MDTTLKVVADYIRVNEHLVIPIPDGLPPSHVAASLLCAGITAYSPLLRNCYGPGKKIGVVGIGTIGHIGVLLSKAMGAEVYAFSRYNTKKEDVLGLGADYFIATIEDEHWESKFADTLDLVLVCSSSLTDVPIDKFATIMTVDGKIISVAVPGRGEKLELNPFGL